MPRPCCGRSVSSIRNAPRSAFHSLSDDQVCSISHFFNVWTHRSTLPFVSGRCRAVGTCTKPARLATGEPPSPCNACPDRKPAPTLARCAQGRPQFPRWIPPPLADSGRSEHWRVQVSVTSRPESPPPPVFACLSCHPFVFAHLHQ